MESFALSYNRPIIVLKITIPIRSSDSNFFQALLSLEHSIRNIYPKCVLKSVEPMMIFSAL